MNKPISSAFYAKMNNILFSPKGCAVLFSFFWLGWLVFEVIRFFALSRRTGVFIAFLDSPSFQLLLCLSIAVLGLIISGRRIQVRKKLYPQEPWMWDHDWNRIGTGVSLPRRAVDIFQAALFGSFLVVTIYLVINFFPEFHVPVAVLLPFVIFAGVLWCLVAWMWIPIVRCTRPFFRYRSFPFFIGEHILGRIEGLNGLKDIESITINLRCVKWYTRTSTSFRGNSITEIVEEIVHEQIEHLDADQMLELPAGGHERSDKGQVERDNAIPVRFKVPLDMPETRFVQSPFYKWQMEVHMTAGMKDYRALFVLPVYMKSPPQEAKA